MIGRAASVLLPRLPAVYKECSRVISEAVREGIVHDMGTLSQEPSTPKRKPAHYHGFETVVDLYGVWYRALVVHSDACDERRIKKLERTLEKDRSEIEQKVHQGQKIEYACLPDAQAALLRLPRGRFYDIQGEVEEAPVYASGRPRADGTRKIKASDLPVEAYHRAQREGHRSGSQRSRLLRTA